MPAQATTILQVPVQLLARVLSLLTPAERLQSAALTSISWHAAAVVATHRIHVQCASAEQAATLPSLSAWLSANCAEAAIRSIEVFDATSEPPALAELQLPLMQLQGLEELALHGVQYAPAHNSDSVAVQAGSAAPLVLAALSALTALRLDMCQGQVEGLAACTGLQELVLICDDEPACSPGMAQHLAGQLQHALPGLVQLTSLMLGGSVLSHDDAVQHVSALSNLQWLSLEESTCSASSLQQLPQSLTGLSLRWPQASDGTDISASSTPRICQLTALKALDIAHAPSFSPAVLGSLVGLERLQLIFVEFKEPGTLSVLAALTQLKHLELPGLDRELMLPTPADVAAVTASSQLTYLDVSSSHRRAGQHHHLFPPGRQLPHLVELWVNMCVMDEGASRAAAACCPNLQRLFVTADGRGEFADEDGWHHEAEELASVLNVWQQVHSLTSLKLYATYKPMQVQVWAALGDLTQLRELNLYFMNPGFLSGMLCLNGCSHLTQLQIDALDPGLMQDTVSVRMTAQADANGAIHQQLGEKLQNTVLCQLQHFGQYPMLVEGLIRVAATAQRKQQQTNEDLQAQVADLQQQQAQLEQRVSQLQASLEAVLRQGAVGGESKTTQQDSACAGHWRGVGCSQ